MSQSLSSNWSAAPATTSGGDADNNNDDLPVPLPKPFHEVHDAPVDSEATSSSVNAINGPASNSTHFYYGTEHHLLGLSPQFHAAPPMLIGDVLSLGLINGVDCITSPPRYEDEKRTYNKQNQQSPGRKRRLSDATSSTATASSLIPIIDHIIPVSRCNICGFIVNMERRANSTLYLLDDGTGLIDCVAWEDDSDGVYSLPPLVDTYHPGNTVGYGSSSGGTFRVGDSVRIRGKIRCISVGTETRTVVVAPVGDGIDGTTSVKHRQRYEIPIKAVREITVATIERTLDWRSNIGLDEEVVHWLKSIQFVQRVELRDDGEKMRRYRNVSVNREQPVYNILDEDHVRNCKELLEPIRNGADVLHLLGNNIVSRVEQSDRIVVTDDDYGAWRLFGPDCSCNLPHKEMLLYCHCLATSESLDPRQSFRDALLKRLVEMQSKKPSMPLKFQYGQLLKDAGLFAVASHIVAATSNPAANARRLFVNTFRALRDDGIFHLDDQESDTYLLISRSGVLEPYLSQLLDKDSSALERSMRRVNPPAYLKKVPPNRLRVVMKNLVAKKRDGDGAS